MSLKIVFVAILLLFSVNTFATDSVRWYVIDGDTIEELQASLDDNSTWKPVVIVEPTIEVERPLADRISFQIARSFYGSGVLGFVGSVLPHDDSMLSFYGVDYLRQYGASNDYIQKINNVYAEGEEIFNVDSTLTVIEDSNQALGWVTIGEQGDGNINIALFNEQSQVFLDFKRLEDYTLYHELSHVAFQREVGGILDLGLTNYELRDAYLFGEYGNDVFAQKTLPEEKRGKFMQVVKAEMERVDYENIRIAFELREYGFLLRSKARAKEHGVTKLENYINSALLYETPEFRQKFLELADEFYTGAHSLNKENFEENVKQFLVKMRELRDLPN